MSKRSLAGCGTNTSLTTGTDGVLIFGDSTNGTMGAPVRGRTLAGLSTFGGASITGDVTAGVLSLAIVLVLLVLLFERLVS